MSIITKRVTMTETAWEGLRSLLEHVCEGFDPSPMHDIDASDAITALAEAEIVAVTDTYEVKDTWLEEMRREGKEL